MPHVMISLVLTDSYSVVVQQIYILLEECYWTQHSQQHKHSSVAAAALSIVVIIVSLLTHDYLTENVMCMGEVGLCWLRAEMLNE